MTTTAEPTYTQGTELVYAGLADYLQTADRAQGDYPLKRFLSAMLDQFGFVLDVYDRIDYLSPGEYGADDRPLTFYRNLADNPSYERLNPLPPDVGENAIAARTDTVPVLDGRFCWQFTSEPSGYTEGVYGAGIYGAGPYGVAGPGGFGGLITCSRVTSASDQPYTVAFDALPPVDGTLRVVLYPFDSFDNALTPVTAAAAVTAAGFTRPAVTLVPPAGTESFDVAVYLLAAPAAGATMAIDRLFITPGSVDRPYAAIGGVLTGDTSELVTPELADDEWLPWLAQLVGVTLNPHLGRDAQVDAIRYASAGWRGGTKAAVAAAARSALTGSKFVRVFDHSISDPGDGGQWDVLIVTRASETPDASAVIPAIVAQNAKPAGVVLHHRSYDSSWATVEAAFPTWAAIEAAGSWTAIEEAGL